MSHSVCLTQRKYLLFGGVKREIHRTYLASNLGFSEMILLQMILLFMDEKLIGRLCYFYIDNCVKSVRIRSYSGPYFPTFGLNNSEYGHFVRSGWNLEMHNSIQTEKRNATRCNNRDDFLHLSFT